MKHRRENKIALDLSFDEDNTMVFSLQVNDAFRKDGNLIANFLIYLSDVEADGATIFSSLRVAIEPRKGSAVVYIEMEKGTVDKVSM